MLMLKSQEFKMSYMCSVGECGYEGSFWKVIYHMITKHFGLTRSLIRKSDKYYKEYYDG